MPARPSSVSWVEVGPEDRGDGSVGERADREGTAAGGFEPLAAVGLEETDDAEAGAEPLLGMGLLLEDGLDQEGRVGPDVGGVAAQALLSPAGVTAVRARHMLGDGGVAARGIGAQVG